MKNGIGPLIGNDIIDLACLREHCRAAHPRFWRKILDEVEYRWLCEQAAPERDIWKLWAMKESAYKCYFQRTRHRFYAPKKFACRWICSDAEVGRALVHTPAGMFYASVWQSSNTIQALCASSPGELEEIVCQEYGLSGRNAADLSHQLRIRALSWVAKQLERPEWELRWEDSAGFPRLFCRAGPVGAAVSLSHHGKWGGVALSVQ